MKDLLPPLGDLELHLLKPRNLMKTPHSPFFVPKCLTLVFLAACQSVSAVVISADFNDLNSGDLQTQAGGTGWSGTWGNTSALDVVGGDLVAPAATGYSLTQGGTAQSVENTSAFGTRISTRELGTEMDGEIWFSVLMRTTAGNRTGLSFNYNGSSFAGPRLVFTGADAAWTPASGTSGSATGVVPTAETFLVLGRLTVVAGTTNNDSLMVWVNPPLTTNGTLNPDNAIFSLTGTEINTATYSTGLDRVGLISAAAGSLLDMVYFSDNGGSTAIQDVTGVGGITVVPEPAAFLLTACGMLFLGLRRHPARTTDPAA